MISFLSLYIIKKYWVDYNTKLCSCLLLWHLLNEWMVIEIIFIIVILINIGSGSSTYWDKLKDEMKKKNLFFLVQISHLIGPILFQSPRLVVAMVEEWNNKKFVRARNVYIKLWLFLFQIFYYSLLNLFSPYPLRQHRVVATRLWQPMSSPATRVL